MSKSQINYAHANTIGKQSVAGAIGVKGEYEAIKHFDFETVTFVNDTNDDFLGKGNVAQYNFYAHANINTGTFILRTNATKPFTAAAWTVLATPGDYSVNITTGEITLTNAGVVTLDTDYLYATYSYIVGDSRMEDERKYVDDVTYVYQSGSTSQETHAVGVPGTDLDGHFRVDRQGRNTDNSASRTGDVYNVSSKISGDRPTVFRGQNDLTDTNHWTKVVPLSETEDATKEYVKDASLQEGNVVALTVAAVAGQVVTVNEVTTSNQYKGVIPNLMYLVDPISSVSLPIASNDAAKHITIVAGFVPSAVLIGRTVYIRKKGKGNYTSKNSSL